MDRYSHCNVDGPVTQDLQDVIKIPPSQVTISVRYNYCHLFNNIMDHKKDTQGIAAVVPAYNEAARLPQVLRVLTTYPAFQEVIVVDDGSDDNTGKVAATFPVRLIRNTQNRGKGTAMEQGIKATKASIIFFCDADVKGLTHDVLQQILGPVVQGKTDMVIGMRNRKIYFLRMILAVIPLLGGERALTQELWRKVPAHYKQHFMIEGALNFYARYYGKGFQYKVFRGLSQTIKEKKYGLTSGLRSRIKMFYEIIRAQIELQLHDVPPTVRSGRQAVVGLAANTVGIVLGALLLLASYTGPAQFVRNLFAEELLEDTNAPLVHFLLNAASNASVDMLVAFAVAIIGVNAFVLILNAKNSRYLFHAVQPKQLIE